MEKVNFSVDASIINRLGLELVTKSETAVAELIKNAYDADANLVTLKYINSYQAGGTLIIEDDGEGMDREKLINGFLRLATSDKIHDSVSKKYGRAKAGRKGIGRFSAQRLGTKLTIETKNKDSYWELALTINWEDYNTDKNLQDIDNDLEEKFTSSKEKHFTRLIIENLREKWSVADIKRVYRYVADLIQPNFLKIEDNGHIIEESKQESFETNFLRSSHKDEAFEHIADPQIMLFNKALATFSGYIDKNGDGYYIVQSRTFHRKGNKVRLYNKVKVDTYELLQNTAISFKAYYYIGGHRHSYYSATKAELNVIIDYLDNNGGVKLYRNGFVVAKYGKKGDDWLNIDKNGQKLRLALPFRKDRIIGFVQITDAEGKIFEESASREGLLEKDAFRDMQDFISESLKMSFQNFASWLPKTDEYKAENPDKKNVATSASIEKIVTDIKTATKVLSDETATEKEKVAAVIKIERTTHKLITETRAAVNELEMMRILAGTGLTIAEFVHEIKQFVPSLKGYIGDLLLLDLGKTVKEDLLSMKRVLKSFLSYTAYFDTTISQNVVRELKPIDLKDAVRYFESAVVNDMERNNIIFEKDFKDRGLITCPMHPSEWNTILQNLYSNAKKAIYKANTTQAKMRIEGSKDKEKGIVRLHFYDNGIGIAKEHQNRIFDSFFTTSKPSDNNLTEYTGMGMGLYILKQIIKNRGGEISIGKTIAGYNTCISIELPLVTKKQFQKYYGN